MQVYGPSHLQETYPDPPEKDEDIVEEAQTLKLTLDCLDQNIQSRMRQVRSLQSQVATCNEMCRSVEEKVQSFCQREQRLKDDPSGIQAAHVEELGRRRRQVQDLMSQLNKSRAQAKRYESLFKQQRRYLRQNEHVSMMPGQSHLLKHAAGEVALVPQPPALEGDDRPEVWDVGTAVANPYVVDSWPFEPNVLARRTFQQDPPMEPFREETPQDLLNEERRLPKFVPNLHLPTGGFSDDDDDGYGGPTGTSRSL